MAVSKHPSVKPANPRKPPSDKGGQGKRMSGEDAPYGAKNEYGHSAEHSPQEYGHPKTVKTHGMGNHKSEFEGASSFPKAGTKMD